MHERNLYEYAVIRVMPKVEREEFLNVGVILFCKDLNFLKVLSKLDEKKLLALCPDADLTQIMENLESFEKISQGNETAGPIAEFDLASRFRWLTAMRSSVIQTSRPHPGFCEDPDSTLNFLFGELVL